MINLDYVACFVIYVFVAFAVLSIIIDRGGIGYKKAVMYSFGLQLIVVATVLIVFVLLGFE